MMTHFRVGGVPEHFNYPWHLLEEQGLLKESGISFSWRDFPGGTGAMAQALREEQIDLALMLTEGAVADLIEHRATKIIGTYVESPLIWGIHVRAESAFETPNDLEAHRFAISRYHSGSHLMAFVNARQRGWNPKAIQFEVVGSFDGARQRLKEGKADAFMWEKFTTKPTVDSGEWRRVGVCLTPWPCFVLVGSNRIVEEQAEAIQLLMRHVQHALLLLSPEERIRYIAEKYRLKPEDVSEWYAQTTWSCRPEVSREAMEKVQDSLLELEVIPEKALLSELTTNFTAQKA